MLFVPLGYTFGSGMFEINEVKGGSAYGAGTFAADGSRQPTELELQQAFYQGKYVAKITKKLKNQPLSSWGIKNQLEIMKTLHTSHFTLTGGNTNSLPLTGYCVKNKKNKKPCVAVTELAQ